MKYKDNATSEERRIIDSYFEGKSPERLANEYTITHNCRKGEALKIVYKALSKISWGGKKPLHKFKSKNVMEE